MAKVIIEGAADLATELKRNMEIEFKKNPKISLDGLLTNLHKKGCFDFGEDGALDIETVKRLAENESVKKAYKDLPKTTLQKWAKSAGEAAEATGKVLWCIGCIAAAVAVGVLSIMAGMQINREMSGAGMPVTGFVVGSYVAHDGMRTAGDIGGAAEVHFDSKQPFSGQLAKEAKTLAHRANFRKAKVVAAEPRRDSGTAKTEAQEREELFRGRKGNESPSRY
ncbi:MAG: hypothetical protein RLN62_03000 [Rickettsiales bacterium]